MVVPPHPRSDFLSEPSCWLLRLDRYPRPFRRSSLSAGESTRLLRAGKWKSMVSSTPLILTGWASSDVVSALTLGSSTRRPNARSRFVLGIFMRSHDVQVAMERAGFHDLPTPPSVYAYEPRPKSLFAKMEAI